MASGNSEILLREERLYFCDTRESVTAAVALTRDFPGLLIATTAVAAHEMARLKLPLVRPTTFTSRDLGAEAAKRRNAFYSDVASCLSAAMKEHDTDNVAIDTTVDTFIYHIKLSVDHSIFLISLFNSYVNEKTREVWFPHTTEILIDDRGLIRPECSIIATSLSDLALSKGLKLRHYLLQSDELSISSTSKQSTSSTSISEEMRRKFRRILLQLLRKSSLRIAKLRVRMKTIWPNSSHLVVLGWNCRETRALSREKQVKGVSLLNVRSFGGARFDWDFGDRIIQEIRKRNPDGSNFDFEGLNLWPVLEPVLRFVASGYIGQRETADRIERLVSLANPISIVVNSLASLESDIAAVRTVAVRAKVPICCWMHGGYGAYSDAGGFDITDQRLANCHVAYGQISARSIANPSPLSQIGGAVVNERVIRLGSPFLRRKYSGSSHVVQCLQRPKIVFCLGPRYLSNRFYYGYARESVEYGLCEETIAVASSLCRFASTFEIVIKDYPESEYKFFWSDFCERNGVTYVSSEESFADVIENASCLIFSWISTTFFEALLQGGKILLWDNSQLRPDVFLLLQEYGGFTQDVGSIESFLDYWLSEVRFLTLDTEKLRAVFIETMNSEESIRQLVELAQISRADFSARSPL